MKRISADGFIVPLLDHQSRSGERSKGTIKKNIRVNPLNPR